MARRIWYSTFRNWLETPRLWLFPALAGGCWFATLSILLIRWVAIGRPQYPEQANPYVPFISDIAAQTFKPVFMVGCALTGFFFFGTVFAVHHVRYSPTFYGLTDDAQWRQVTSLLALVAGLAAAVALFMLSIFDTVDATVRHRFLLMGTFGGLFISAITTALVWWDQSTGPKIFVGLRKWCLFNNFLVLCQFVIGVCFTTFMYTDRYRSAGYMEWILCYIGSFWLMSFVGFTRFREGYQPVLTEVHVVVQPEDAERQPLLA